ncbi:unannotated protein [freshwater metagenome]|uniref:Unannotated protein n=1 Tax=freshwater metagenome TaxID=449393 RepID=A0A6J5YW39_9ZZZZ
MLTPVNKVNKYIIKNEPKIALTPTTSGMALATKPPKTKANKINVNGMEMDSANAKSLEILLLMA